MSDRLDINWRSPGPVSSRYMRELKFVNILNGPIGAGKTRTVLTKGIRLAAAQEPSKRDGLRRFKLCGVQENYRQLWRSTIPSIHKLLPRSAGEWTGAENGPGKFITQFQLPDRTTVHFQLDLIAIGDNAVEDVMRGYEPTAFWLIELDLLAREVYQFARGRAGRYPDMADGGPTWYGILGDCNAPERTAWLYEDIFKSTPDDVLLLKQPSGFSPEAENVENLPPGYYTTQAAGQPEWYLKRMIENVPGFSRAGKPVYGEFTDALHFAGRELEPIPGIPLRIGLDGGGSPAASFAQKMPNSTWRLLDEIVTEQGTGAIRFGRMIAQMLHDRYPGWKVVKGWADPSSSYGADKKMGEKSWREIVEVEAGIRIDDAPTNELLPRLEAVRRPLTMLVDGKPGLIVSSRCPMIHEGFNVGYQFKKMNVPGAIRYDEVPDKGPFSHVMNAVEYLLSAGGEDLEIRGRKAGMGLVHAGARHEHDWDPFG